MMVLEIELQHAESFHTLVLSQIPQFMSQFQDGQKLDQFFKFTLYSFLGTHGIEIQVPSTTTPDRNSRVVIYRGKNRFVDELRFTSYERFLETSIAKERQPCSAELEHSRFEETHATLSKISMDPEYLRKEVVLAGERKWNDILAWESFTGDSFSRDLIIGHEIGTSL